MSREKLREAIAAVEFRAASSREIYGDSFAEDLRKVLAAARAYACERCGGRRLIDNGTLGGIAVCPDCAGWRRIADGGES